MFVSSSNKPTQTQENVYNQNYSHLPVGNLHTPQIPGHIASTRSPVLVPIYGKSVQVG